MDNIFLISQENFFLPGLQDILRLFFKEPVIHTELAIPVAPKDLVIRVDISKQGTTINANISFEQDNQILTHYETTADNLPDSKDECKRLVRLTLFRLLEKVTGTTPNPWGILTGIRPTKVLQKLFDLGFSAQEITDKLVSEYALSSDKADLVTEIASVQRKFLPDKTQAGKNISVYIGIPFCPTRCLYCSFTAYPIKKFKAWVEPYLNALTQEIKEIGRALRENGLTVQTIYLGGGTPTSINREQLASLLNIVNRYLRSPQTVEITMEGGRPDTLTPDILDVCSSAGINRLSINPQTMLDQTLKIIGRNHTVEDIYQAMASARLIGFPVINMDIIVGLPGENENSVKQTMELIKPLKPENLTVHALALKNASLLKHQLKQQLELQLNQHQLPSKNEAIRMWEITKQAAYDMGMLPYYLYRQKRIAGDLENIGYSLPGKECLYNIQMIEEKQTIIGLGAGGSSKLVHNDSDQHINRYNPKDPSVYIKRIEELITWKVKEIEGQKKYSIGIII